MAGTNWDAVQAGYGRAYGGRGHHVRGVPLCPLLWAVLLPGAFAASGFSAALTPTAADVPYGTHERQKPECYQVYDAAPALGQSQKDPTHTANCGVKLQDRCRECGVPCELVYPGAPCVRHLDVDEFLVETLAAE